MYVIRPIALEDLPALMELTRLTGFGLTTLPHVEKLPRRRIKESLRGLETPSDDDHPVGEIHMFVMEHLPTKEVSVTCGVSSKVGGFEAWYACELQTGLHTSAVLRVRRESKSLHLVKMHSGPCVVGTLFLSPE